MPAAPAIIAGASAIGSAYLGYKASKDAQKRSSEEQAALTAQTGLAGQMGQQGKEIYSLGSPMLSGAGQYYNTLLRGNRTAMQNATAGPAAAIGAGYKGAATGVSRSYLRGGQREQALADLGRQKTSAVAGLTSGQQGPAAQALFGMGSNLMGASTGSLASASGAYGGILNNTFQNRVYGDQMGAQTAASYGALLADLMQQFGTKSAKYSPVGQGAYRPATGSYATGSYKTWVDQGDAGLW